MHSADGGWLGGLQGLAVHETDTGIWASEGLVSRWCNENQSRGVDESCVVRLLVGWLPGGVAFVSRVACLNVCSVQAAGRAQEERRKGAGAKCELPDVQT